ncbi:MFS transporter [Acidicapsa ligni]|uniref:MFS transporter n=1 Tax=Acidicapsa ligni TaxID=542300 RepID=UPI0021DF9F35|nr:MFS transporter [Acidicapsa ligni]
MIPTANAHVLPPCIHVDSSASASPCTPNDRKWVLIAIILGSSLAFMDSSVVNVALPRLQAAFQGTSGSIQWIVQSYALFTASLLLPGGAIGDRYGRRRIFIWGIVIFALASVACALSLSLAMLVASRIIQGIGAALLIPQGLSILSASFPADQRGRAIGTWSAWTSVFAALGPVAGGWLIQIWSWRLIFLLNVPIAMVVVLLSPRIPESRSAGDGEMARPLDRLGAALATLAFAALIYALSFAPEFGWHSPKVILVFMTGLVLLAAFLWSQSKRTNAMIPLSLFRIPRFLAANLLTFLLYGALTGALYVTPFYLIQVRHYAPVAAGAVFLPLIALMFVFSARVGDLIPRIGERVLLALGAALAGAGFIAFALLDQQQSYVFGILPGVLLLGAGMTCAVAPLTTAVMSSVLDHQTGIASAVNNALSRMGGLLAVSVLSLVLAHGFAVSLQRQLDRSGLPVEARNQMVAGKSRIHDIPIPAGLTEEQRIRATSILDMSFLSGFRLVMFSCAFTSLAGAVVVLVLLRNPTREHDEEGTQPATA